MGSMKSIVNLDRITESWNVTSLSKISDIGLLWFSSVFGYLRSVGECSMMDFYVKVKSVFCMDLRAIMMHVTAKIPRFCNYFDTAAKISRFYNYFDSESFMFRSFWRSHLFRYFWRSYVFRYFRSVADCFIMDFYEKVKSILCMDLPASMMHVTAKNKSISLFAYVTQTPNLLVKNKPPM